MIKQSVGPKKKKKRYNIKMSKFVAWISSTLDHLLWNQAQFVWNISTLKKRSGGLCLGPAWKGIGNMSKGGPLECGVLEFGGLPCSFPWLSLKRTRASLKKDRVADRVLVLRACVRPVPEVGELSSEHWSARDLLAPCNIKQWKLSRRSPSQC